MPKIVIKNLGDKVINTNATDKSVLSILQENYQDWMHACGGKGRCTSCRMIVKEGMSNMSELNIHEQRYREKNALQEDERLTCQSVLQDGEIIIEVPAPTKLPHLTYSY